MSMSGEDLSRPNGELDSALRIGVFGERGSGKTSLLAAFYGRLGDHVFSTKHKYHLHSIDKKDRVQLTQWNSALVHKTRNFPDATSGGPRLFRFDLMLSDPSVAPVNKPAFGIEWLDYAGGWLDSQQELEGDEKLRQALVLGLRQSQVVVLLVDGAKFKKKKKQYLGEVLSRFKKEIERCNDYAPGRAWPVIDECVIALTKSDLFTASYTAKRFESDLKKHAAAELSALWATLGKIDNVRCRYLLLSAIADSEEKSESATERDDSCGLDLVTPIAVHAQLARAERGLKRGSDGELANVVAQLSGAAGTGSAGLIGVGQLLASVGVGTTVTTGTAVAAGTTGATVAAGATAGGATAGSTAAGAAATGAIGKGALLTVATSLTNPVTALILGSVLVGAVSVGLVSYFVGRSQSKKRQAIAERCQAIAHGLRLLQSEFERPGTTRVYHVASI